MNYYKSSNFYFSHVYIEERIKNHPKCLEILKNIKFKKIIYINNYTNVFHRLKQNYNFQKNSQKLILAKKDYDFFYKGSIMCENYGIDNFYYSTIIKNCIYKCSYCYLQGLYSSANIVIFINIEDYFNELEKLTNNREHEKFFIALSYDTDLLSFEYITGFINKWNDYINNKNNIITEIKTKSNFVQLFNNLQISNNILFSYTILPQQVIDKYEIKTPNLKSRINSIKTAINKNVNVSLAIEPILSIDNYKEIYTNFIDDLAKEIDLKAINKINIGAFRMSKDHYMRIKKNDPANIIFTQEIDIRKKDIIINNDNIIRLVTDTLSKYIDINKIFLYDNKNYD